MTPKRFLFVLIIIIVLIAIGGVAYYTMSHDTFDAGSGTASDNSQELTEADIQKIVKTVSEHILLPEGEEPVAAKIIDVDELLKTQPFYRGALNGDILLIYQTAAKAILYSPSRDILVNVGPIILDEEAPVQPEPSIDPAPIEETQSPDDATTGTETEEAQ